MSEYTVSDYLLDVIKHLGEDEIFGVPGDYNLQFLDHITHRNDMQWIGNANELNASYVADGYAREKGMATFVTTFGVGELSGINGLSGSIAEHVPVLEIVGAPTNKVQNNGALVHHTLGDREFKRFEASHEQLGIKVNHLNTNNAINQINETLQYIYYTKKPAYMILPSDLVNMSVNPAIKANISELFVEHSFNVDDAVQKLSQAIEKAKQPIIVVGHEIDRFNLGQAVESFSLNNNLPVVDLGLGKGAIDETFANFVGTYNGSISDDAINNFVKSADSIILMGTKLTDSVTGGFTQQFDPSQTITISTNGSDIYGETIIGETDFVSIVKKLADTKLNHTWDKVETPKLSQKVSASDNTLTQAFYDQAMQNFIQGNNTLVAEQGTSFFGLASQPLAKGANFIGQPLWGSIGYAFPAALGSQIANPNRRTVLSTGEGSLQLTIQEFGLAFREQIKPVIFIIENSGYTVERVIHGMNESYNDVPKLRYDLIPQAFGANDNEYDFINVNTEKELINAMDKANQEIDKLVVVQVNMGMKDAPEQLMKTAKLFEQQNQG
ncbi:alpha-keto acid decarboxylase family protein [Apilactobacillus xinyiensis]|uniref:alpha-keto acid decarboxylase family protein n=1 Tax=Apilactobacillus xinyiensis TaxID=2841032 RepID=UPI003364EA87